MPLLAIVFTFIAYLISKKNKLFSNKKVIFYILLISLLLSIPGLLGFLDYEFMPYYYIFLSVLYLVIGWFNIGWVKTMIPGIRKDRSYLTEFMVHFVMMFIGAAFFSMIFNFCNELQFGLWACTCVFPFIFPSLFYETYLKYLEIPLEVHKIWTLSNTEDLSGFEYMDYNKLMVLELEFSKQLHDKKPTKVKAKAPDNLAFGTWFQKFILDYNLKFPRTPIELRDKDGDFGWIFYVKRSFFVPRKYIDYELSVIENKIKEKYTIVAKRAMEEFPKGEKGENEENEEKDNETNNLK
jgi:hypothetical protein